MQHRLNAKVLCGLTAIFFIAFTGLANSTIYKYQKDGVWHFTDTPGEIHAFPLTPSAEAPQEAGPAGTDLNQQLAAALKPKNEIETAVLATVAIETPFGHGTGFFVTADGYIVTNKHVIRQSSGPGTADDPAARWKSEALDRYDARIEAEMQRLEQARADIDAFRRYIDSQPESPTRQYNETRYLEGLQRFQRWEETMNEHRRKLASERSAFQATVLQRRVDASLAGLNRHFTVRLADNRPLHAYVVEISKTYDLALLKVDGFTTPFLTPENPFASAQGEPVYAIGNPVGLRNSVTAGVVSGFDGVFVKTNAQIYPGNSGGPLVTARGRVVGINTFKRLTRKYEGLGFAISIKVAVDAFDAI